MSLRGETTREAESKTLRIGTFNIHGGRGPDGNVDLGATAEILRANELDLAGLYEVHGSFRSDQAEILGENLNMASLFAGTEQRWWHDRFGNGLLTRRPIQNVMRIALPGTQGKRFRNAILAAVDIEDTRVNIIAAHLDTGVDQDRQLATVIGLFRSLKEPAVLMGDLNCTSDHPMLAELLSEPGVVDAVSQKLGEESRIGRVDHLLTRGLDVVNAAIVITEASDHPYVWAELKPVAHGRSAGTL